MTQISMLTLNKFASFKYLPVLTSRSPSAELSRSLLFDLSQKNTTQEHPFNLSLQLNESQGELAARMQRQFGHCSWLYQLVVTVRGSSLLPHQ